MSRNTKNIKNENAHYRTSKKALKMEKKEIRITQNRTWNMSRNIEKCGK
jgi:hypothetical protein